MGMTMTQKILAAHAGLAKVEAGQLIEADLDLVLGNDITSPVAIHEMDKMKVQTVFDKDKIALVPDHFVPNKDIKSAELRLKNTPPARLVPDRPGASLQLISKNTCQRATDWQTHPSAFAVLPQFPDWCPSAR